MNDFSNIGTGFGNRPDVHSPTVDEGRYYEHFVDAYDLFPVLQEMFEKLGLLETGGEGDNRNIPTFRFIEEYPDDLAKDENASVVFALGERTFWKERSTAINSPSLTQRKPLPLTSQFDIVENNIVTDYAYYFDNVIRFEVFSTSLQRVMQVARLLESTLLKHKGRIKLYVHDLVYLGQSATEYHSTSAERRLFSRTLAFRVVTYSRFSLVTEEIKKLNVTQGSANDLRIS